MHLLIYILESYIFVSFDFYDFYEIFFAISWIWWIGPTENELWRILFV